MTAQETGFLLSFFNQGGYVLNFSNNSFSTFTMQSVGIDLQGTYGGSKGSSLVNFVRLQSNEMVIKLFCDLLEYYEFRIRDNDSEERKADYEKCRNILDKYKCLTNTLETPTLKQIDNSYIRNMTERAMENIKNGYYDSALTQARTLLEDVFIHIIEKQNVKPLNVGKIEELYKQVKSLYHMHNDPGLNKLINGLLSGLNNVVSSIGEMRNIASDSHGYGSQRKNIKDYHARLYVNSAMTLADFVLSVAENNSCKK